MCGTLWYEYAATFCLAYLERKEGELGGVRMAVSNLLLVKSVPALHPWFLNCFLCLFAQFCRLSQLTQNLSWTIWLESPSLWSWSGEWSTKVIILLLQMLSGNMFLMSWTSLFCFSIVSLLFFSNWPLLLFMLSADKWRVPWLHF